LHRDGLCLEVVDDHVSVGVVVGDHEVELESQAAVLQ
jgi:hypothetical protein